MEDDSTGVLEKNKEHLRSKDKAKNDMMYQDIYNCICQNTKNEDILSIVLHLQPNCCLEIDFQKVDQLAGGKCHTLNMHAGWICAVHVCV